MKSIIPLVLCFLFIASAALSQDLRGEVYNPPIPYHGNTDWGIDKSVSTTEPFGKISGVYRTSNTSVYVAIPDTNIVSGKSIVILSSTNNGTDWGIAASMAPAAVLPKVKMTAKAGSDSLYCFFISGSTVYCWNVITNNLNPFTTYTDVNYFDVTVSSTNSLYLIIDRNINNDVRMFGTTNSGLTWGGAIFLSSTGANPTISMSGTGDTALIVYYGVAIAADTVSGAIRTVRYRESAAGTLAIVGAFLTPLAAGTIRPQFKGVIYSGKAWVIYSSGTTGSLDMNCIQSDNNGTSFGAPFTIGSLPGRDEYWFDARYYSNNGGGVDLIYYSDSVQVGLPTNVSDILYYTSAPVSTPTTFAPSLQISGYPPQSSSRNYYPNLIEYFDASGDKGALWVGNDAGTPKVFYDNSSAIVPVELNSFTSTVRNNSVTLKWETGIEINNSGFEIQRKTGNEIWTTKGFVSGKGNTNGISDYIFEDNNLSAGIYSYRLKQIDFNGNFKYYNLSNEVVIGLPEKFELSQNYPNPFNPATKINFVLPKDSKVTLIIFDISGKLVATLLNGEFKIADYYSLQFNGVNLSTGTYFYRIEAGEYTDVKKMILIK